MEINFHFSVKHWAKKVVECQLTSTCPHSQLAMNSGEAHQSIKKSVHIMLRQRPGSLEVLCVSRCATLSRASKSWGYTQTHTVTAGCPGPGRLIWAQPIQTLWSPWSGKGPGSEEFVHANTSHFLWQNITTCPTLKDPHSGWLKWPYYSPPGSFLLTEAFLVPTVLQTWITSAVTRRLWDSVFYINEQTP